MANYSVDGSRTADAALAVIGLTAHATTPRRCRLYELGFGSEAAPADNVYSWAIDRGTTALGTSTAVTPSPLDPADVASLSGAGQNYTVNPTIGVRVYRQPLNQRASFRWVAQPGKEIVLAAVANLSLVVRTPTMTALAVAAYFHFEEL